jgi:hypothetical protein
MSTPHSIMQPDTVTILLPEGRGHYRTHYFSVTHNEDDAKILARLSALSPTSLDPIELGQRVLRVMTMSRLFIGKAKVPKVRRAGFLFSSQCANFIKGP